MSAPKISSPSTPATTAATPVKTSTPAPAAAPPQKKSLLQQFKDLEADRRAGLRSAVNDALTSAQNRSSAKRAAKDGDGIVSQNSVNRDGTANTRTTVPLKASAAQVNQALLGDWSKWWNHSVVTDRSADGKAFTIKPLGNLAGAGPTVDIKLGEPQRKTDAAGLTTVTMPMTFTGSFEGKGTITIAESAKGQAQLTFDWPGIKANGLPPALAVGAHTLALEGDTPFFNGTGFEGLKRYLEAGK